MARYINPYDERSRLSYLEVKEALNTAEMDGHKRARLEMAKQMKSENFELSVIARLTGLSLEEIQKL